MNAKPISTAKTLDLRNMQAALARAALTAKEVAKQFNTPLIVRENGRLVKLVVQ